MDSGTEKASLGHDYWTKKWAVNSTPWHVPEVNGDLIKHEDIVLDGKEDAQVFVPMCGKTWDLKWFYDKGHRVVGVEYVESAARGFFEEVGFPFAETVCDVLKCKIFQTPDGRLRIFVCSILDFKRECAGPMDIVTDRGALCSIREDQRERFVGVMKSLLAPGCSYALWTMTYDEPTYKETPRNLPDDVVFDLFRDFMTPIKIQSHSTVKKIHSGICTVSIWHMKFQ